MQKECRKKTSVSLINKGECRECKECKAINNNMYKNSLDKSSRKFICPSCGKKTFVRYVDNLTKEYSLPYEYGRCDREVNCCYFKKYIPEKESIRLKPVFTPTYVPPTYHDYSLVEEFLKTIDKNQFINFLKTKFSLEATKRIIDKYKIGNVTNWYNGTIFWQIDQNNKVRAGKIICYDENGRRFGNPNWIHSLQIRKKEVEEFNLKQCLFGLHLTRNNNLPIAIVESEKTACIMSEVFPKFIWMATGSLSGLNKEKLLPLKNKSIILYPDLGINTHSKTPYERWESICYDLKMDGYKISISDFLERLSTEEQRQKGYDLADFILSNQFERRKIGR